MLRLGTEVLREGMLSCSCGSRRAIEAGSSLSLSLDAMRDQLCPGLRGQVCKRLRPTGKGHFGLCLHEQGKGTRPQSPLQDNTGAIKGMLVPGTHGLLV
jgi:hypothetical protein